MRRPVGGPVGLLFQQAIIIHKKGGGGVHCTGATRVAGSYHHRRTAAQLPERYATYLGGQLPVPLLASHHLMTKAMTVFVLKETGRGGGRGVCEPQGSRFHQRPSVEFCPNRVEFPCTVSKIAVPALHILGRKQLWSPRVGAIWYELSLWEGNGSSPAREIACVLCSW